MDAVITYVNITEKFRDDYYLHTYKHLKENRFRSYGVLDLQVKGIRKYMQYIKNIFVVVCDKEQVEGYDLGDAIIIEHKDIIPSRFLPCFNSCTIEMFLHKIPNLSEEFIYFNDDIFITAKVPKTYWFINHKPVLFPKEHNVKSKELNVYRKNCINSTDAAASITGKNYEGKYITQAHCARPFLRSSYVHVFNLKIMEIIHTLTRIRHSKNFNATLFNDYDYFSGNCYILENKYTYINIKESAEDIMKKMTDSKNPIICINDNDEAIGINIFKEQLRLWLECNLEGKPYPVKKEEIPIIEEPIVEEPKLVEIPVIKEQPKKKPVEKKIVDAPEVKSPKIETQKVQEKKEPVKEPVVEKPTVKEPAVKEPTVKEPKVKTQEVEKPVVKEPVVKEPTIKEPEVKKPTVKKDTKENSILYIKENEKQDDILIDFVFPYVDCDDPEWIDEYNKYSPVIKDSWTQWSAGKERFRSNDLLRYVFRSIEVNLPWINKVFMIVMSESQVPKWINKKNVNIIYHKDYIPEEYLPTFNSNTIECFFPKLPEVSEYFIYGNDDVFITSYCDKSLFFENTTPVYFLKLRLKNETWVGDILRSKDRELILGKADKYVDDIQHTIMPYRMSTAKEVFELHKDTILNSIDKFRKQDQYNQWIFSIYQHYYKDHINRRMKFFHTEISKRKREKYDVDWKKFNTICLNDSKDTNEEELLIVKNKFEKLFPNKSKYEI